MPPSNGSAIDKTVKIIMENNCTTCTKATERVSATGHTGYHCTLNDIDVNRRMGCEEHEVRTTMEQPQVSATSILSLSTQEIRRH